MTAALPLADRFQALADPTRLRILALLRRMELSVGELAQELVSPSTFRLARVPMADRRRHLQALEQAFLDPDGELEAHLDPGLLSIVALRRRGAGDRFARALAGRTRRVSSIDAPPQSPYTPDVLA